jgi:hypothetical protein
MRQSSPGVRGPVSRKGSERIEPAKTRPSASVKMSLKPGMSSRSKSVRDSPSRTWQMSRPETTMPPSACNAIPPTPRRRGTIVSIEPSGERR